MGEVQAVLGVHLSPEAGVSAPSQRPWGNVCTSVHGCTVQGRSRLPRCVCGPRQGRSPCPLLGVGPGSEKGHPRPGALSPGRVQVFPMPCAMRTATALLGSLLWLEMVRPGAARAGSRGGAGAGRFLALSLSPSPCRSEDWPLPAGGERTEGHL